MYKFNKDDAIRFATEQGISYKIRGDELIFRTCPYCKTNAKNDKEKFAINLNTGQFNCFRASCKAKGNMINLHKDFNFSLGNDADEYYSHVKRFRVLPKKKPESTNPAIEFMKSRGISETIARSYNITTQKEHDNIIVFPFYDENGVLCFVKYRNAAFRKGIDNSKEWCESDCRPILFGMDHCDPEKNDTLIITEGQIDSLSVAAAGFDNVVSVPTGCNGFTWVPECWDWMLKFKTLIVFGDYERGGMSLLEDLKTRFGDLLKIKHVRFDNYMDCKDANDILRKYGTEQVRKCVNEAVEVPNKYILHLADVRRERAADLERFDSMINPIDNLTGGIYLGRLYLVTGSSGLGKSTFASQLMLSSVKAGYKCFIYSGELSNGNVQEWLEFQIAGADNINSIKLKNGFIQYSVSGSCEPDIRNWYRDKIDVATDGDNLSEMEGEKSVYDMIKDAIIRCSCRIILVDNLMTAIEEDSQMDQYREQTKFVKALKTLTRRFNVSIFLVVHPRKHGGQSDSNDDIAGSSNIVNLADYLFWLKEADKEDADKTNRRLYITKNRIDGRTTGEKGIQLYYEPSSRRYSSMPNKFDWSYGWETQEFSEIVEGDELPFD